VFDNSPTHSPRSLRNWMAGLDPRRQMVYGCLGVALAGMFALYCAGSFSLLVRPFIFQMPPAPIPTLAIPTSAPTPTSPPAFLTLPNRPVPSTPTQGSIPTRGPSTPTATPDPFTGPERNHHRRARHAARLRYNNQSQPQPYAAISYASLFH
jgi:hypothetical protein